MSERRRHSSSSRTTRTEKSGSRRAGPRRRRGASAPGFSSGRRIRRAWWCCWILLAMCVGVLWHLSSREARPVVIARIAPTESRQTHAGGTDRDESPAAHPAPAVNASLFGSESSAASSSAAPSAGHELPHPGFVLPFGPHGRLSLVIEDAAADPETFDRLLRLDAPFTFAIAPHRPGAKKTAAAARRRHREVVVVLPLPAHGAAESQGGTTLLSADLLVRSDSPAVTHSKVLDALNAVPYAAGVWSAAGTGERTRVVFETLRELNLFFVDNSDAPAAATQDLAREIGILYARRDLYIDNDDDVDRIIGKLYQAADMARQRGSAIACGRCRPALATALKAFLPHLASRRADLVKVSALTAVLSAADNAKAAQP